MEEGEEEEEEEEEVEEDEEVEIEAGGGAGDEDGGGGQPVESGWREPVQVPSLAIPVHVRRPVPLTAAQYRSRRNGGVAPVDPSGGGAASGV